MINSFETLFEARERKFQQERLFRGESVDLVARITTDGVLDNLSNYTISGVYQPVGDDPEGLTYTVDSEIRDGKAILHWTNDNDFGKTAYNVWGLLMKDGKGAYPIAWRLNFANSPSYPIDEINPLVRTIDFDKYDLLNAPWVPLSGGNLSGRIYLQEGETPSTLLSSYLGDATGLGRGIITIYDETEATLEAKLTQSGSSVAAKWIFTYFDTPTGEIVFPDNPQPGDTFDVLNGIGTKYLNGADVTMEQDTTMFQWQTGDTPFAVPCLTLHNIVTRYTYNSGDGWTASSTYDWSICKVNGEWYANSFNSGYSAHDSIVWHEESSGEQPVLDPFVLQSELDEAVEETKEDIKQTLQDEYLPLSGGTVSGDFAVQNFLSSTDRGVFLGKNQDLNQYAELAIGNNLSVGMVGIAMGSNSEARSNDITIGHSAKSPYGGGNIVIGNGASTASVGTTVVGTNAKASAGNAIAIGTAANATQSGEVRLGGPQGNIKPQLWLFETPIISGPDLNIVPERLGWLSDEYATQEWVNEQISSIPQPSPPTPAGILTIKQNETTVAEYNPDDGTNLTATIDIPTVPTDLSDFTNSPGYATETWVEEYVDEHGGGGGSGDYLPLSGGVVTGEFAVEDFLSAKANDPGYGSSLALGHNTKIAHDGVGAPDQQVGGNLAIGNEVSATGFNTIAIGGEVVGSERTAATAINSIAIGLAATATKEEAIAIGNYAKAISKRAIGIGTDISANAYSAIAIGTHAEVKKKYAVQIGEGTNNTGISCLNYLSANIVEPQNGNLIINPDRLPYLSDYATETYVQEYVDQHAASGDYLPLSGGTVDGPFFAKNFISADYIGDKVGTIAIGSGISAEVSAHTGTAKLDPSGPILIGNNTAAKSISQWNPTAAGIAIGNNSTVYGTGISIGGDNGLGSYTTVSQGHTIATNGSVAIGKEALAGAYYDTNSSPGNPQLITTAYSYSVAIGDRANALSSNDVAIGVNAKTLGTYSVAIGNNSNAKKSGSIVIGSYVKNAPTADGLSSIVIGADAVSNGNKSIIIGPKATTIGSYQYSAIGIGDQVSATVNCVAIGSQAATLSSTGDSGSAAIAIGTNARTTRYGAIQLGYGTNSKPCSLQVGSTTVLSSNSDWGYSNLKLNPAIMPDEYATESYVDTKIGDINSILDSVNGQII